MHFNENSENDIPGDLGDDSLIPPFGESRWSKCKSFHRGMCRDLLHLLKSIAIYCAFIYI